ncbi:ferroxidase FET3 KNAG_0M02610 [Huiozyma naganishii CBS 8797]|uniref:Ferroxidase n=1 Tax=Huiozyma naganishii (strain ATCC MYA-139 / BCRC 22969 / CBS 8797 / KCTC 17520 / NBRC 10181 / NCYC 3082 / Yp74L-3) TaxID=1071383 RepID=J7SAW7_HUIN7|nr:hypothetical protein KNAG_0M02610 [Kazachstania naganishii CBS 8797]CCK73114.1 hypothetical protein KNAG_0M02610 [Kazachstania naganishii CBS 8797]
MVTIAAAAASRRMLSVLLLLCLSGVAWAKTHRFEWTAAWGSQDVDGVGVRPVITCNGQWPWPDIRVDKGDQVEVYLTNGMNDSTTSLHFHGLFQRDSGQMDGPPMVTNCPLVPGDTILYNFTVADQVGTYWYHSHTAGQYEDGMRGLFIINDGENNKDYPYEYDEEVVLSIGDWYTETVTDLSKAFLNLYNPTGAEPIPRNLILNNTRNLTWDVKPDTTYLLRICNIGGFVSQYFWIEDHDMTVVQIDGVYTQPNTTNMLYVTVAQRYSVLIHTKNDTNQNFAIMQKFDETMLDVIPKELELNSTSFMMYNDSLPKPEQDVVDELDFLDDFYLTPLHKEEALGEPDHRITLDVVMDNLMDGKNYAFFNNITYTAPKVPTLMTVLSAGDQADDVTIYGSNTNTFVLKKDEIVELVLNNQDTGNHPFHLHGHVFQALIRDVEYDDALGLKPVSYDPDDHAPFPEYPMIRDTIYLRPQSNLVIRFKADNPGVWFFHCHIEWHLLQGLAIVLVEDPASIQASSSQAITANHLSVCANSSTLIKGNAAGNTDNFLDLTGEHVQLDSIPTGFTKKGIIAMTFSCFAGTLGLVTIAIYGLLDVKSLDNVAFNIMSGGAPTVSPDDKNTSAQELDEEFEAKQIDEMLEKSEAQKSKLLGKFKNIF